MLEGVDLIVHAWYRHLNWIGDVSNFRRFLAGGWEYRASKFKEEFFQSAKSFLNDPDMEKVFSFSVAELREMGFEKRLGEGMAHQGLLSVERTALASILIIDHTTLDLTLLDYLRATTTLSPEYWDKQIQKQKVEFGKAVTQPIDEIRAKLMGKLLHDLAYKSLLNKSDMLHSICKPSGDIIPQSPLKFDRTRLEKFDDARHNTVHDHDLTFQGLDILGEHDYVRFLGNYFFKMLWLKYHFTLDEDCVSRATKDFAHDIAFDRPLTSGPLP